MRQPVGLAWIGTGFRSDAHAALLLAIVKLAIIKLGGARASAFAPGYGTDETSHCRVLALYPVLLAGMNPRISQPRVRGPYC